MASEIEELIWRAAIRKSGRKPGGYRARSRLTPEQRARKAERLRAWREAHPDETREHARKASKAYRQRKKGGES